MDLLIYAVCLGLGIFFLLIGVVVEHVFRDHEAGLVTDAGAESSQRADGTPTTAASRLWSPTRLAAFVLGFGGVGVGLSQIGLTSSPYISAPLALAGGAVIAAIVQALCRRWFPAPPLGTCRAVGSPAADRATVVSPIPEGGRGEIAYADAGMMRTVWARTESGAGLAVGRVVRITRRVGLECFVEETE
jgi:hypothetical protein